ncbi:hypothetical protein C2G38_2204969 [Gigaspora rosea]|uniref:FAR1 domain-containing protein n=1 Tax=Gigaspora rosea TaxID=44941 RepID=A0A397UKT1_9GLOM|nr:hypothetical protein C2G38_2204969 [Gigaspora rosea]
MASDERESFDGSGNTVLSSQTCHSSENKARRSFGSYDDISRQKEKLKLAMWPLQEDLENTSIDVYNLLQEYYSDYHSSEAYLPNLSLHSPAYAFSSNSSSQSESDDDIITSQHKYLFNIRVDDTFGTFEKVEKKLDRYAMERGFAVRKLRTCMRDGGTVWDATWVCHLSGQWKSKKTIDPDNQHNRDINITNCKWHCNFSIGNQATRVHCSLLN